MAQKNAEDEHNPEVEWYDFVNQVSNKVMLSFANHLMDHISGGECVSISSIPLDLSAGYIRCWRRISFHFRNLQKTGN